MTDAEK